jgi:hypothetical protein
MTFSGPTPRPAADPRALGMLVAEVERFRDAALRAAGPPSPARETRELPDDLSDEERRVVELLVRVRELVLSQPAVGHAVTTFLLAEGRRFSTTSEGARWLVNLRDAPEVERLRQIWEATTLNVFDDEHDEHGVPEAWVDLIIDLSAIGRVDRIVAALLPEGLA